ncbi:MAG TPA: hypothetical protein ENK83_02600, partial [Aliiroseovarius sp.]|nr:hypothetical protein [Aliiroseovarius sp.]
MLHFRSPAVENDLPPALDMRTEALLGLGSVAMPDFTPSGLAQGSVIETARGAVLARDLRVGDRVLTRDRGLQPVRWVGASTVIYDDPDQSTPDQPSLEGQAPCRGPVRVRAGAFGVNADAGNLVMSPGQRLLARNRLNEILFASTEVLASAGDLTHLEGIDFAPRSVGHWTHVLLDSHELLRVNGLWMESFSPDMGSIRVAYPEKWHEIT